MSKLALSAFERVATAVMHTMRSSIYQRATGAHAHVHEQDHCSFKSFWSTVNETRSLVIHMIWHEEDVLELCEAEIEAIRDTFELLPQRI